MEVIRQLLNFEDNLSDEGIILLATKLAEKVYLIFITHRLISARAHWTNTSRGTKVDSGSQAMSVIRFDIRRPILVRIEKQEKKSVFFRFNLSDSNHSLKKSRKLTSLDLFRCKCAVPSLNDFTLPQ